MSELSLSQFDGTLVIVMLDAGGLVARGFTPSTARTLVSEVLTDARENQDTSSRPSAVAVRSAGIRLSPPPCGVSSTTGALCTGRSERRPKLCSRMSPAAWKRVSFHTMLTVPARWLTATRGKSLGRDDGRKPGRTAVSIEVTGTATRAAGPLHPETWRSTRQCRGSLAITFVVGSLAHGPTPKVFVPQLCS